MKFRIGDQVRFKNDYGDAEVIRIISETMVGLDIGRGIEIPTHVDELFLVSRDGIIEKQEESISYEEEQFTEEEPADLTLLKNFDFSARQTNSERSIDVNKYAQSLSAYIVDLHIEKLTDDKKGKSNAELIQIQLLHFEEMMDQGFQGIYKKIIFIHGVGNGRLKKEIVLRLKELKKIQFGDASISDFGFGATEVVFL